MLQIEERQKLYSSLTGNTDQHLSNIGPPESREAEFSSLQPTGGTSDEVPSTTQMSPSTWGKPLTTAWPSPPSLKRSTKPGRSGAQPYSPPSLTRPVSPPTVTPAQETKRAHHGDHSRESSDGSPMEAPRQTQTSGAANNHVDKQPPLAGPNVMNIVVVAAECAPWSKTGGHSMI